MQDAPIIDTLASPEATEFAGGLAALGGAVSAYREGDALAHAEKLDAMALEREVKVLQVQATQQEVIRRQELARTLATQAAFASARRIGLDAGTREALATDATREAEADVRTIRLSSLLDQLRVSQAAANARYNAKIAKREGFNRAVDVLSAYFDQRARIGVNESGEPRQTILPPLPRPKPATRTAKRTW